MAFYEVIMDHGETANKCTIAPLAYRADFALIPVTTSLNIGPLRAKVLLNHEGTCLSQLQTKFHANDGIASVDCVWRRLDPIMKRICHPLPHLVKVPDGFVTVYPRKSKHDFDPEGGLATIEAIFIAAAMLGDWDESLLSEYYFGEKFIVANLGRFADFGIERGKRSEMRSVRQRNALQRRINRGRWRDTRSGAVS